MKKDKIKYFEVRKIVDLRDMVRQSAELYPDCSAFTLKDSNGNFTSVTYKKFLETLNELGTALLDLGLKNAKIAVMSENRYEWCLTYLAVVNGVGIIVPLDRELPLNEVVSLLTRSEATAIVTSANYIQNIINIKKNLPDLKYIISMDPPGEENNEGVIYLSDLLEKGRTLIEAGNRDYIDAPIDPNEMRMLIFTSGTTDKSKGVMLSHRNICADIMGVSQLLTADTRDSILSILPLHHTYECTAGFLTMIYLGVSIGFCEGLRYISKNIQEYKPSIMMSVPLILENVYNKIEKNTKKENKYFKFKFGLFIAPLLAKLGFKDIQKKMFKEVHESLGGRLRLIISGASALNPKVSKAFRAMGFNLLQGYGLTECSPIVTVNRIKEYKDGSVGLPLPGVEIKIDNPGRDKVGEIVVKGDNVMLGYFKNEEATREVLKDGWLYTGDYGRIDKDGFLYITGRKKNVIVTKNGKNIYPEDIELYLNQSPYILESLVYGVNDPGDDETKVCAQIVPKMEAIEEELGKTPTDEELHKIILAEVKKVNKKLSSYKRIQHFDIRKEEFEKTTTKKIKRYVELLSGNISNLTNRLKIK
ncbi:long-chain-fatty-acid--CoA ligase FadD [Thermoclostridium stercorarium subsp. stercorarium DSM 8532]|jgi:long-chain acyl-CoA synthetase|uniref:Long-chain-fatty-acid--CoA ligase FadD n=3 Tax=Thermoclostridium stercorarium TaxID=1510 RepID=L7VLS1_THES1|nr:AMP-binding protein [Thermoclostridium stercorarium]AGC67647.1 long-chain-fatty-acid--CoA ligase FadD [Thermoclostridium stercorarium subsp. stercorarium DSM 8532]AGI38694.1 acyl-CoA synthetase [Thermoclostridium stercorarium subsp. stercorarium DSM 8532]ANW98064.1 AMP-dependent synthetase [Thermoclostridium stercorarium subsp. thermolacticum DSM 2910]ANX00609.1 AMP-dependent synthetase [Thermoclostridium stercorarium subsp. leptospartum DSM 9219]